MGASVAFRFPASGGEARLYRLPDLDQASWLFHAGSRAVVRTVGLAGDDDLIYTVTGRDELVALDLVTGRTHTVDTDAVAAALGPTGTAYVVHSDGSLGNVEHRSTMTWSDTLTRPPSAIWGAVRGRLIVVVVNDEGRELVTLAKGQPTVRQQIPAGHLAMSKWGDLAVVATESGLATFDPADPAAAGFIPLEPSPRLVTLSPSAHRIYAAVGPSGLIAVERFQQDQLQELELPGRVGGLRMGPAGRTLLARPEAGDSIWIVNPARLELLATVPGTWDNDLPAVAPDGTIVLRRRGRVVALDRETLSVVAAMDVPDKDRWLLAAWNPRRPTLELASDTVPAVEQPGQVFYVQVSSSRNPAWAESLASELRDAGMSASVLADSTEELYRVVLGPHTTRGEADAIGRRLGQPYWILTLETDSPIP